MVLIPVSKCCLKFDIAPDSEPGIDSVPVLAFPRYFKKETLPSEPFLAIHTPTHFFFQGGRNVGESFLALFPNQTFFIHFAYVTA